MSTSTNCPSATSGPGKANALLNEKIKMRLVDRQLLTHEGADKEIFHISLEPCTGQIPEYRAGDCLAIYPQNQIRDVSQITESLKDSGSETHILEGKSGQWIALKQYLLKGANLTNCSASLAIAMANALNPRNDEEIFFKKLCTDTSQRSSLLQYCRARTIAQLLTNFSPLLTAQQLCDHLQTLLPRLYSIASAFNSTSNRIDLTVSYVQIGGKWPRQGVCSHWLCKDLQIEEQLTAHLKPHKEFHLPDRSEKAIIMIGAGTGIAPFRGFLQQRVQEEKSGSNWLFMGQRERRKDFLYENFWRTLQTRGCLRLDLAFSRDQSEKLYVSHIMCHYAQELACELKGDAIFYVCGSIALGKSVHQTLKEIAEQQLGLDALQAELLLRSLRKAGRYKRDVY